MSTTQLPLYIYTGGKLKKVEKSEPKQDDFETYPLPLCMDKGEEQREFFKRQMSIEEDHKGWESYVDGIPGITVHPDLAKVWKEGERPVEGKDFNLKPQFLMSKKGEAEEWKTFEQPFYRHMCPERQIAIPLPVEESQDDLFRAIKNKLFLTNLLNPEWTEDFKKEFHITRKIK